MTADLGSPLIDWRRYERCQLAAHPTAYWHIRINASGRHIEFYCPECDAPVTAARYGTKGHAVSAEWLLEHCGVRAAELPEHRRSLRYHLCYLCGTTAQCEFHHVAPQAIYGKDADKYPIVPLCESCHDAETKQFTDRLETYVQERIRRYLARRSSPSHPTASEAAD